MDTKPADPSSENQRPAAPARGPVRAGDVWANPWMLVMPSTIPVQFCKADIDALSDALTIDGPPFE